MDLCEGLVTYDMLLGMEEGSKVWDSYWNTYRYVIIRNSKGRKAVYIGYLEIMDKKYFNRDKRYWVTKEDYLRSLDKDVHRERTCRNKVKN